jgi:hypothetical protein
MKQFLVSHNKLRNRKFKPLRDTGPKAAGELVEVGIKGVRRPPKQTRHRCR